jgi:hypothetical protein
MSQSTTQLAVLSGVSVGMWSAKKDRGMWFLIVPRQQLFVFIVEDASNSNPTAAGKRRRFAPSTATLLKQLGAHSPFSSAVHKEGAAFAFEVALDNISGIDYSNSLVRSGKLVLEAFQTRKREFENIDSAFAYYGGTDGEATRASLEALFGDSSPYKEQRNSLGWEEPFRGGGGTSAAAAATNPGLPAPPLRRTKTNLLARLGSAVGAATKSNSKSNNNKNESKSSSSPAVSTTISMATSITTSAITIGNIIVDGTNGGDENEITSALTDASKEELSFVDQRQQQPQLEAPSPTAPAPHTLAINTTRVPNSQFLFSNPVRSTDSSSSPTRRRNLGRISQSTGDVNNTTSTIQQSLSPSSLSLAPAPRLSPSCVAISSTPAPAASNIYEFRLITVHWTDPQLPEILRPIMETNEVLLRLYESGLPTWATFFPRAGLYYRPWLRSLTWVLFYAFSFFSLAVGFYDLYKSLPGLQTVLSKMVAGMWLPPAAVLQWIEEHAQIRLSILLTYIFGKSEMFLYVVRMVGHAKRTILEAAGPVISTLAPPLQAVWSAGIAPAAAILRTFTEFTLNVLVPPLQALFTAFILPITWLLTMIKHLATAITAAGSGGSAVAASSPWIIRAIPTDTINTLRNSLAIPTRAANSVWRSMNQMVSAFTRHRLTWSRRAHRWRISMRKRIVGAVYVCLDAVYVCWTWIWAISNLIVAAGKAGVARQRQEEKDDAERVAVAAAASTAAGDDVAENNKKDV